MDSNRGVAKWVLYHLLSKLGIRLMMIVSSGTQLREIVEPFNLQYRTPSCLTVCHQVDSWGTAPGTAVTPALNTTLDIQHDT